MFKYNKKSGLRNFRLVLLQFLLLTAFTTCKKDEAATRGYPRINTLQVSEITTNGAKFSAEIISGDPSSVKEYGFTWNEYVSPRLPAHENTIIGNSLPGKRFSGNVQSLKSNQIYYLRAFLRTDEHLIYGTEVTFRTLK